MDTALIKKLLLERLSHCSKGAFEAQVEPNIPPKHLEKVKKCFGITDERVLGVIDTSLFGRGKNGIVFTEKGVYFKDVLCDLKIRHYTDDWRPGQDTAFDSLGIKPDNALIDTFAVTGLMDAIVYGLSGQLDTVPLPQTVKPAADAPAPEGIAEHTPPDSTQKADTEGEDDDDNDDDDDVGLLDLFGVILDVTSDPSEE